MEQEEQSHPGKREKSIEKKTDGWIEKAESYIDEAAEKIHQSNAYRKAGKQLDKGTQSLFKKAGRWWGKINK